jgi:hypothetical protein
LADLKNTTDEELQPAFPVSVVANGHQPIVVLGAMLFQVVAQIKQGAPQRLPVAEKKGDEEPSDSAIAVKKWVDGFKLRVSEPALDEQRG